MLGGFDELMGVVKRYREVLREDEIRVNTVLKIDDKPGLEPAAIDAQRERVERKVGG